MKHFKKKYIPIYILAGAFIIYNIIWLIYCIPYIEKKFELGFSFDRFNFTCVEGGYMYSVAMPGYLSKTGNLSLSEMEDTYRQPSELATGMIIFPNKDFDEFEVWLDVEVKDENGWEKLIHIKLDENMKPLDFESEIKLEEYPECKEAARLIYKKVYDKWGILGGGLN